MLCIPNEYFYEKNEKNVAAIVMANNVSGYYFQTYFVCPLLNENIKITNFIKQCNVQ